MNSFSKVFKNIISDIKVNGKVSKPRDLEVSELPYSILIKKLLPWNEYKILTINKK